MDARCAAEIARCIRDSAKPMPPSRKLECLLGEMDWRTEAAIIAREQGELSEERNTTEPRT